MNSLTDFCLRAHLTLCKIQTRVAHDFCSSGGSHVIVALLKFSIVGVLLSDIAALQALHACAQQFSIANTMTILSRPRLHEGNKSGPALNHKGRVGTDMHKWRADTLAC